MNKTTSTLLPFIVGLFCILFTLPAQSEPLQKESHIRRVNQEKYDSIQQAKRERQMRDGHGSIFGDKSPSLADSHFTWGGEVGASVDMGGNDMSTFDVDVMFGYKNKIIKTIGVGAGIHRAFGQGNNFVPVYAVIRMYFSPDHDLFFLNLKGGYSFNSFSDHANEDGLKGCLGIGCNLSRGKRANSHIILSCGYFRLNKEMMAANGRPVRDIFLGKITFGVNF